MTTPPNDERQPEREPDYEGEITRWHAARARRLQSADGWLTLIDRRVLAEGDNELEPGTFTIRDGQARFRPRPGAAVSFEGRLLPAPSGAGAELTLRAEEGDPADTLSYEGRSYELFRRGHVFAVRVKDPDAPARRDFRGINCFPIDPRWRIVARFDRYDPPRYKLHEYDIGPGWRRQVPGIARFALPVAGSPPELSLEPVLEEDSNRLFFMFGDLTNREQSYPAGRFLYAPMPSFSPPALPSAEIVLDFNMAFNPPCAFTPHATCPVLPAGNRLPVAIPAGEQRYEAS